VSSYALKDQRSKKRNKNSDFFSPNSIANSPIKMFLASLYHPKMLVNVKGQVQGRVNGESATSFFGGIALPHCGAIYFKYRQFRRLVC